MTAPLTRATLALLGAAVVFSGCNAEPATVTDNDAVLRLKLDEYSITPQNLRVIATSVPMELKIVATNVGRLTHTVKVERIAKDDAPDSEGVPAPSLTVDGSPGNAAPGEVVRTLPERPILLEPGEYRLVDTIGNHENLGAYGTLTIEPPPG